MLELFCNQVLLLQSHWINKLNRRINVDGFGVEEASLAPTLEKCKKRSTALV